MKVSFDVFLFILTLFNAASRPRRANVKIITDLRRDGCLFYLVRVLLVRLCSGELGLMYSQGFIR